MNASTKILKAAAGTAAAGGSVTVDQVFSTTVYTGDSSAGNETTGIDLVNSKGLIWFKWRSGNNAFGNALYDTVRGKTKQLVSNTTAAESTESRFTGFRTDGFSLSGDTELDYAGGGSGANKYVAWTFKAAPKFFDVVTYTGNGGAQVLNHSLGSTVGLVIIKRTDNASDWTVGHRSVYQSSQLKLNSTAAGTTNATFGATWSDTTIQVEYNGDQYTDVNRSGGTYIAYIFADNSSEDAADRLISCDSLTVSSQATVNVNLGFEAQWVMLKKTDGTGNWLVFDVMRGMAIDSFEWLYWNTSDDAEVKAYQAVFPTATGFGFNPANNGQLSDGDYIYMAIRRDNQAEITDATKVFDIKTYQGASNFTSFSSLSTSHVDLTANFIRTGYGGGFLIWSRLTGPSALKTWSTAIEGDTSDTAQWDFNNKITITGGNTGSTGSQYVNYFWKRAKSYFDLVAFTGDSTAQRGISHGLGVVPEMIWIKNRDQSGYGWIVGMGSPIGWNYYLNLNNNGARGYSNIYFGNTNTSPTSSQFYVGRSAGWDDTNRSSYKYIAYLFASVAGVSKVSSVVHSGTTNVDAGFTNGSRFVLIKRTDAAGDWYVWDSVRGVVSGNDPYLLLNSNAAEVTNTDYIDPYSAGFTLTSSLTAGTYIYYAIA